MSLRLPAIESEGGEKKRRGKCQQRKKRKKERGSGGVPIKGEKRKERGDSELDIFDGEVLPERRRRGGGTCAVAPSEKGRKRWSNVSMSP